MGRHGSERLGEGNTPKMARRRLLLPVALFRRKVEEVDCPCVFCQQFSSIQIRVLFRSMREFVNKTFDGKQVRAVTRRPKHRSRNHYLRLMKFDFPMRYAVMPFEC